MLTEVFVIKDSRSTSTCTIKSNNNKIFTVADTVVGKEMYRQAVLFRIVSDRRIRTSIICLKESTKIIRKCIRQYVLEWKPILYTRYNIVVAKPVIRQDLENLSVRPRKSKILNNNILRQIRPADNVPGTVHSIEHYGYSF
jgi:hypothetical protein